MKYNVITPFVRFQYFGFLKQMLYDQMAFNTDIKWHILIDDDNPTDIDKVNHFGWIKFYRIEHKDTNCDRGHTALNKFLDMPLDPNERYLFLCDDDSYEPSFFEKINNHKGKVIICSMERGNTIPKGLDPMKSHPTNKLWACKENMKVCHVGMEQLIITGDILSKYRIPPQMWGDGMFIEKIVKENETEYAPEANVWFNYYEPGRWKK